MAELNPLSNISYTNKDFQTIYPELLNLAKKISYKWDPTVSNESDPGVLLLKLCAIIADKNDYNIDKNILECFPLSVTQESNARQLFEQLGYTMHWYRGGTTVVSLQWIGDRVADEDMRSFSIPQFTMVSDEGHKDVFTLIDAVTLTEDGATQTANAIQGVYTKFSVNGLEKITASMLDSNNRIYFNDLNVAENGVFISKADGSFGTESGYYGGWRSSRNLTVEPLGSTVYKFGITQNGQNCYIEFPEDIEYLMGEGLYISYIKTDGRNGNIAARVIETFYADTSAEINGDSEDTIVLNSDNVAMTNVVYVGNGEDPETIDSAYRNYRKTVGTFNTLVTLRDYNNAVNNSGLISNGFVCDRTNDLQCSYQIITKNDELVQSTLQIESGDAPTLDAFDLKMYLLEYIQEPGTSSSIYNQSFDIVKNFITNIDSIGNITETDIDTDVLNVQNYIEDEKCIQHDYMPLLLNKICLIKNKYPIRCRVVPKQRISSTDAVIMAENIRGALYYKLNSKEVDFGSEIQSDEIYDIIMSADERIKTVMMEDMDYSTYAVYYDGSQYREVAINNMNIDNMVFGYYVGSESQGSCYYDDGYTQEISPDKGTVCVDLNTGRDYEGDGTAFVPSIRTEFQKEIWAKSVLAGQSQLLTPDEMFDYSLTQNYDEDNTPHEGNEIRDDIASISTNTNIDMVSGSSPEARYEIKENEHIVLYAPNMIEKRYFSTYVRFQFHLANDISTDEDHELTDGESITFYWKNSDEDIEYQYAKYGSGSVIRPSFRISADDNSDVTGVYIAADYPTGEGTVTGSVGDVDANAYIAKKLTSKYVLSGSKKVGIVGVNEVSLNSGVNYCFWILNMKTEVDGVKKCILFNSNPASGTDSYILQSGEYFIYTNASRTSMDILGSGTKITRTTLGDYSRKEWAVDYIDYTKISDRGISALENKWFVAPKTESCKITEMRIVSLNPGTTFIARKDAGNTINLVFKSDGVYENDTLTHNLSGYSFSYIADGETSETPIPKVTIESGSWDGRSLLSLSVSPSKPQAIQDNQMVSWQSASGSTGQIQPSAGEELYILSNHGYNLDGGSDLNVSFLDAGGVENYMSMYAYEDTTSPSEYISYNSDDSITLTFDSNHGFNSIKFNVPKGKYVIPIYIPKMSGYPIVKISVGTYEDHDITYLKTINYMYSSDISSVKMGKVNYLLFNSDEVDYGTPPYWLRIEIQNIIESVKLVIKPLFKFKRPVIGIDDDGNDIVMSSEWFQDIFTKMTALDPYNVFDYTYVVDEDVLIDNPVKAESFFRNNHIFNKFTIPQLDTELTDILITDKAR